MGVILNIDDCCKQDHVLKSSVLDMTGNETQENMSKTKQLSNKNNDVYIKEIKQNLVILIVTSNSLENCKVKINENEIEYQISNFYVIEQMKINAKVLTPKAIYEAILASNKNYSFLHDGFVYFTPGSSPLYKKFNIVNNESSSKLIMNTLYYMFNTNYDHYLDEYLKRNNSKNFKKSFDQILYSDGTTKRSSIDKFSENYKSGLENRIQNKYKKLSNAKNKFETIGELDSINSSYQQNNITLNTNNLNSYAKD